MRKRPIIDGPVQVRLLDRARGSELSLVFVRDYQEMRAARALVARGVLAHVGAPPAPRWAPREPENVSRLFVLRSSIEERLP